MRSADISAPPFAVIPYAPRPLYTRRGRIARSHPGPDIITEKLEYLAVTQLCRAGNSEIDDLEAAGFLGPLIDFNPAVEVAGIL